MDASGTIIKDTLIGPVIDEIGTENLTQTLDGNFVIGGETQEGGWQGHVFKFTEDGDSIWHRYYYRGDRQDFSSLYNFKATADSGFVMAGTHYDVVNNPGTKVIYHWLKKVDQYGCEVQGCESVGLDEIKGPLSSLAIYPNPFGSVAFVNLGSLYLSNGSYQIYDAQGKEVKSEEGIYGNSFEVEKGKLNTGLYTMVILEKGVVLARGKLMVK